MTFTLASWSGASSPMAPGTWRCMAMRLPTMLLAAAIVASGVAGQSRDPKTPTFAYPFQNDTVSIYHKMDTVMVTYTSFYETADLWTFCQPGVGKPIYRQKAPGFTATVPILLNFTSATPCWFNVRTGENGKHSMNSQRFHVIGEERSTGRMVFGLDTEPAATSSASTSSASSSSTSAPDPKSQSSSSTADAPPSKETDDSGSSNNGSGGSPPSPDPTATDSTSSPFNNGGGEGSGGPSPGVSAGIGVGTAVGVIALAGAAFMLWRRRRRRQQGSVESAAAAAANASGPGMGTAEAGGNGWSQSQFGGYYGEPTSAGSSAGSSAGLGRHYANEPVAAERWEHSTELSADKAAAQRWERRAELSAVDGPGGSHHHEMSA